MPRLQKDVVDYFPHDANACAGDTLTVLQSRFGNDGYAVWFKLLEKLASAEGHYLDCRNPTKWKLFIAKMGVDEITTVGILNLLVEMNAIDKELWESKLIWCQNLVNNLSEVYKNRRRGLPQKPIPTNNNRITTVDIPPELKTPYIPTDKKPITTPAGTQSRVEESRVEESRVNNITTPPPPSSSSQQNIFIVYEQEIGQLTPSITEELKDAEKEYGGELVIDAVKEAVSAGKRNWRYINGILENWRKGGGNRHQEVEENLEVVKFGGRNALRRLVFIEVKNIIKREPQPLFWARLSGKPDEEILAIYKKLVRAGNEKVPTDSY